jgi:hypothetical protein
MTKSSCTLDLAQRSEVLERVDVLDPVPDAAFNSLTELASSICSAPFALVVLVEKDRHWLKSVHGLDISQVVWDQRSFCAHTFFSPT